MEPQQLGRVSSLTLANHSADEGDADVSLEAFIPPPLLCFTCHLCLWMWAHTEEGWDVVKYCFRSPASKKITSVKLSLKPRFVEEIIESSC